MVDEPKEPTPEEVVNADLQEMEERLGQFEEKVQQIRAGSTMPDPPELKFERPAMLKKDTAAQKSDRESYRGLGVGLSVAYTLLGLPVFGFFLGQFIDRQTGREGWAGWLGILGFVAGIWFTVMTVNRLGNR